MGFLLYDHYAGTCDNAETKGLKMPTLETAETDLSDMIPETGIETGQEQQDPEPDQLQDTRPGEKGATEVEPETPEVDANALRAELDSRQKALRATTGERDSLKRELHDLKQQLEQYTTQRQPASEQQGQYQDAGRLSPVLKGLNYDPDTNRVELDGQWETPRAAKAILFAESVADNQEKVAQQEERETATKAIVEPIQAGIAAQIAKFNVPDAQKTALNGIAEGLVAKNLLSAGVDLSEPFSLPENFSEIAVKSVETAMNDLRALFGGMTAEQLRKNADVREKTGLRPGKGPTPTPQDKSYHDMTSDEKERLASKIMQNILNEQ